jgi:hypothetical protein
MKNTISLLVIFLITISVKSQALNFNASFIKKNYQSEYESTLKKHALDEWKDDFSMVVYEINKQADALIELIDSFKSDNTQIVFKAIQEWSLDGYQGSNISKFKEMSAFDLKSLIKMQCDWSMVKYEYNKQVKAKNAF